MRVLTEEFKKAVRSVKAAGKGGVEDEQRVIVRAETGKLVLVGIGTEETPGTEAECRATYEGEPTAVMTSLVGLRWLAGIINPRDLLELTICEKEGLKLVVVWSDRDALATLRVRSESILATRQPTTTRRR